MNVDRKTALKILTERCEEKVVLHSYAVRDLALNLAKKSKVDLNIPLIEVGAILHDIGRSKTHGAAHGFFGAKIAQQLGISEDVVHIIERHVGGGISEEDAELLGLSKKEYIPKTPEEKLVSYADKCISEDRIIPIEDTIERFAKTHGNSHSAVLLLRKLKKDVEENILQ